MGQCETKSKQQTDSARSSPSVRIRTKSRRMQVAVAKTKKGAEEHKPHEFKVLLVGDSKVGKTSLILQLADGIFLQQQRATIGVDFKACTITVGDTTVLLNIWDTAGQERFRSITSSFYRGMEGVIVVYDVTEPDSFTHVRSWLRDVEEHGEGDAVTMIVGKSSVSLSLCLSVSLSLSLSLCLSLSLSLSLSDSHCSSTTKTVRRD
ncbi:GTPase [Balamuthia mandrillaris]